MALAALCPCLCLDPDDYTHTPEHASLMAAEIPASSALALAEGTIYFDSTHLHRTLDKASASIPHAHVYKLDIVDGVLRVVFDTRGLPLSALKLLSPQNDIPAPLAVFSVVIAPDTPSGEWLPRARALAYPSTPSRPSLLHKRAIAIVNPHSGAGRGARIWAKTALPLLASTHLEIVSTMTTTARHHAETYVRDELDTSNVDIVIVCSGDGLVHEVFNGLAANTVGGISKGSALSRVAIAHVPCGSGNAFARSLYGTTDPRDVALIIPKGACGVPMDLASITQDDSNGGITRKLSFLSTAIGLIARADLDTEWARRAGDVRISAGVAGYSFARYPASVWIKPVVEGRAQLEAFYQRQREKFFDGESTLEDGHGERRGQDGLPPLVYGSVKDPLESSGPWYELDNTENLSTLYCGNIPYVSGSDHIFPLSLPADGTLDLIWLHRPPTIRMPVFLANLIAMATGAVDMGSTHYCKISAMRVIPDPAARALAVDGEREPLKEFQVEIHHALGRVVAGRDVLAGTVSGAGEGVKKWTGDYVPSQVLKAVGGREGV